VFRKKLREGELDDKEIDIDLQPPPASVEIVGMPGMEEMQNQLSSMFSGLNKGATKTTRMTVKDALKRVREEEAMKLVNEDDVFIDEIDKVAKRSETAGTDVSREGVQRDLLPLIEGCTVSTKYGMIKTDHILFIASGAFHLAKPSDLIPELQGRLPIRVELQALTPNEFRRILSEPDASLTEQYTALLGTEGLELEFAEDGLQRIAEIAWHVNENTENIGARRLHTVLERLLDELSFEAGDGATNRVTIDAKFVDDKLAGLAQDQDLSRFIL